MATWSKYQLQLQKKNIKPPKKISNNKLKTILHPKSNPNTPNYNKIPQLEMINLLPICLNSESLTTQ